MDEGEHAKEMARRFLLEAAKEHDGDQARLLVCVAKTWLEVLSAIERREVTAQEVITVDQLVRGLWTRAYP
jgi:hypothetical protein